MCVCVSVCVVLDSNKTIEGSTAAYLAQLIAVLVIHRLGENMCFTELFALLSFILPLCVVVKSKNLV